MYYLPSTKQISYQFVLTDNHTTINGIIFAHKYELKINNMSVKLNNYLSFNGNCKEAFALYEKVFNTKVTYSCTYGQQESMPAMSEVDKNKMLHCYMPINEHVALMGSDIVEGLGSPALVKGNNVAINISVSSAEDAKRMYADLSADGTIIMPLEPTFWAQLYAMFTDKFGIDWMINYSCEEVK